MTFSKFLLSFVIIVARVSLVRTQWSWKLRTGPASQDCSVTCGTSDALSGGQGTNLPKPPYICAVNGSAFGDFNTGTQVGTLLYVGNILSCWVFSGNPGGPSSTPHSDWYCLCGESGSQIRNATGSSLEDCGNTCSGSLSYDPISACQRPEQQAVCFYDREYTFGYQNASSASTDHSCLAVSPPSTTTPQNPAAIQATTFQCLCATPAQANSSIGANCTTQSYTAVINGGSGQALSPGAIAGIVIGAAAVILIAGTAYFVIRVRRRRKTGYQAHAKARAKNKVGNAFAEPEAQMSLGQKSSGVAPSELLAFDLAVANVKSENQSSAITTTKGSSSATSSSATGSQPNISSAMFADVQDRFGAKSANLPTPASDRFAQNAPAVFGIQSICLNETSKQEIDDVSTLKDTWKIKPEDLECRMANGKPVTLGEGGYGKVYLGVLHREEVAIKVAISHNDVQLGRFVREIKTLRACTNPNIVQFIGACVREKHTFMVMEYMPGGNLLTCLREDLRGDFAWYKRGRHIALDIAKGLIYLHSKNIAHLDLKSPNVMLAADGRGKLGDVGLGKLLGSKAAIATDQGSFLWASPEQLTGQACGTASDIFAFGTVLWEICSHELPNNRALRPLNIPEEAPAQIVSLIDICHQPAMEDRPTATTVHDLLIEAMRS